ncbi:hypothetical protein C7974DRAFT_440300 [Boeremia exigua]|uniref:uncharacterized protein n=1 Tax=Boeremia exigua TaxID=749465 RepID=UPI001E8D45A6|nr:uncharacterized protein C7974DRAFT_440300 [Boeremia exigua]KAH6644760.1 hypothetical protein C7974DRAFT_440300 [Boeremia exigua]
MECLLDFRGHKHADTSSLDYEGYVLQEEPPSACDIFEMSGLASADGLRNYLKERLQPHHIIDEYGDECTISEISTGHLPVLQTKMWSRATCNRSPTKSIAGYPSAAQVLVANHVAKISQLLEEDHVFVLSNTTLNTCQYMKGLQPTSARTCQSQSVRLEPLVHWGTLTPGTESRSIFSFHRDGELMQQPEYMVLVRRLVGAVAPTYCLDCLDYLRSKCTEALEATRQLQYAVQKPEDSELRKEFRLELRLKLKDYGSTSGCVDMLNLGAVGTQNKSPETTELYDGFGKTLPQLDGAPDSSENDSRHCASSKSQTSNTIWLSSDSEEYGENHNPSATVGVAKSKHGSQIIDLITPPRAKERTFGLELDTNARFPLVQLRRSPRNLKTDVPAKTYLSPVRPMKPLKAVSKRKGLAETTKKHKVVDPLQQTNKPKKPCNKILKPDSTVHSISPLQVIVYFAKRAANTEVPDGVATLTYEAFQVTSPVATAKICCCNKPAGHGTSKKKGAPQIAECNNLNCRFRWYHYACLNLSDKGKARFGTLLCQYCRGEEELAEQGKRAGWSMEKLVDFKMPWTKQDIDAEMPGLGGHAPLVHPYGLGISVDNEPEHQIDPERLVAPSYAGGSIYLP